MLQNKTSKFYTFMEDLFIQCLLKMINKYSVYITRADLDIKIDVWREF